VVPEVETRHFSTPGATLMSMQMTRTTGRTDSAVLSLRVDGDLLDRLRTHAARSGMSVQDYVVRTLLRDDFDQRFRAAVEETEKHYGPAHGNAGP
jgi:hypothetical protein